MSFASTSDSAASQSSTSWPGLNPRFSARKKAASAINAARCSGPTNWPNVVAGALPEALVLRDARFRGGWVAGLLSRGMAVALRLARQNRHGKDLNSAPGAGDARIEVGRFDDEDVRCDGVHDELGRVADEETLEPGARHHAHRDDGAAFLLRGPRDGLVRPALHEVTMA